MLERYEKLIHQGELPRLRIVPIPQIRLHEETEPARLRRVAARLEREGMLQHPPIVSGAPRGRTHLLLDGAHRTLALRELALRYVLVQVVDYADRLIELQRWHHLIEIAEPDRFLERVARLPGVRLVRHRASAGSSPFFSRRGQIAQLILRDRSSLLLLPEKDLDRDEREWLDLAAPVLRSLVGLYKQHGFVDRISYDEFDWVESNYPRFTALVVFPQFSKQEIRRVARSKEKLPAGITRHLIPKRALRFDLPLWILSRNLPPEELNRRLVEMILDRTQNGRVRFYSESTFSFDE
ncbi:MAG: hypothetical protein GF346_05135 [Candidatus Eisenbacteria bacterium]|nr:hypothetical protein [Candidatus Latescibacterota bacterium]MBD3301810.1 hypothetical protein [Candidatus Eisenbacteria bacterium]